MTRILLTGASSFTGTWFASALAAAGLEVVAACRLPPAAGGPERQRRLARLAGRCRLVAGCPFGSAPFLDLIRREGPFALFCHHGAKACDHRDPALDPLAEAAGHAHGLERVLDALQATGCRAVLLTGTVFEAGEGQGDPPLRSIGPYGLAKSLSWQIFRHHAEARGLPLAKFVIANPIGPLEKPGLSRMLGEAWLRGETPMLQRPQLIRDQLQVESLALAYARFACALLERPASLRLTPSQFPERLDRFADRLATALAPRLGRACRFVSAAHPAESDEPVARCGVEPLATLLPGLDPERHWDGHARALQDGW